MSKTKGFVIYRFTKRRSEHEHDGYQYVTTKRKAEREQRKENKTSGVDDEVQEIKFDLNKKGIVKMLNIYASYPYNG